MFREEGVVEDDARKILSTLDNYEQLFKHSHCSNTHLCVTKCVTTQQLSLAEEGGDAGENDTFPSDFLSLETERKQLEIPVWDALLKYITSGSTYSILFLSRHHSFKVSEVLVQEDENPSPPLLRREVS